MVFLSGKAYFVVGLFSGSEGGGSASEFDGIVK